jgi:hypothetical protein
MKLKNKDKFNKLSRLKTSFPKIKNWWKFVAVLVLTINFILVFFFGIVFFSNKKHIARGLSILKLPSIATNLINYPRSLFYVVQGTLAKSKNIVLEIKKKNYQKIEFQRQQALVGNKNFQFIPARIGLENDQVLKAKIRLKGDRDVHYENLETASYRVRIEGDNTLFGMKRFSLQRPKLRNYIHEWIFLSLMEQEGIIAPNYLFVNLKVNGVDRGVFALEERYEKLLIERHQRREGPIIRLKEGEGYDFKKASVLPYRFSKWSKPKNLGLTKKAVQLLDAFRKGEITASEAFDVDRLAAFFAIGDLTEAQHGLVPKSIRFYYNPIISKLEPIPFDGHVGTAFGQKLLSTEFALLRNRNKTWLSHIHHDWFAHFFNNPKTFDPNFVAKYIRSLNRVTKKKYLDQYFTKVEDELSKNLSLIYSNFPLEDRIFGFGPGPFIFDKNHYYQRASIFQQSLNSLRLKVNLANKDRSSITLEIQNMDDRFPVVIDQLICQGRSLSPATDNILIEQGLTKEPKIHRVKFSIPKTLQKDIAKLECKKLHFHVLGLNKSQKGNVLPWPKSYSKDNLDDLPKKDSNINEFPFVKYDSHEKIYLIGPGSFSIEKALIIPSGVQLHVLAGTKIWLNKGASIISQSPFLFKGSKSNPILVSSQDKTGKGIFVYNTTKASEFHYTTFENMTSPSHKDWSLSGMINFHEVTLKMSNVTIKNNQSEDALNIIRSKFELENINFENTKSDALDVDFGQGIIKGAIFLNSGNDAIDVSGSNVSLEDIEISGVGDKGISAGERSFINGKRIKVLNSEIAIASKDNSKIILSKIVIANSKLAFTAYQKKPEFGPAEITIQDLKYDKKGLFKLIEKESLFIEDGIHIQGDTDNVENQMYGKDFGKNSK